jgi:hypothetical protein
MLRDQEAYPATPLGSPLDSTPMIFWLWNSVDLSGFDRHKIDYVPTRRNKVHFASCSI